MKKVLNRLKLSFVEDASVVKFLREAAGVVYRSGATLPIPMVPFVGS